MSSPPRAFSLSASSSRRHGRMQCARASMNSLSVEMPRSFRPSISPRIAFGLTTTPGPMILMQSGYRMPDGISWNSHTFCRRPLVSVSGVVAALRADNHVSLRSKDIDVLALALVAPLSAQYDFSWHSKIAPFHIAGTSGSARHACLLRFAPFGSENRRAYYIIFSAVIQLKLTE